MYISYTSICLYSYYRLIFLAATSRGGPAPGLASSSKHNPLQPSLPVRISEPPAGIDRGARTKVLITRETCLSYDLGSISCAHGYQATNENRRNPRPID